MAKIPGRARRAKPLKIQVEGKLRTRPPLLFKDYKGRFMPHSQRYTDKVASVWAWRRYRYVPVLQPEFDPKRKPPTPERLVNALTVDEWEKLPEATVKRKDYTSRSKFQAWDVAEQIDKTRGLRRKLLKITMDLTDGKRKRKVTFYTRIKGNQARSYQIFTQMNRAIGAESMFLYNRIGTKLLAERFGKKVRMSKVVVEEVL